jgi:glycosyltransferase involved in cell wall biosynthesis
MSAGAVIIPAFNAAATLDACLSAICASTRKPDDVIVFDDGSIDDTGARAKRHGATLISHYGASLGPAECRNRASRKTAAEILVFIDADVEVHVDAIARLETEILSSPEIAAAFGSYDDAPHCTRIAALYANLRHHFVHQQAESDAATFWSGLGAIRGDAFQAVDGFDNRFPRPSIEDIELGARLKQSGLRIRLVAAAQGKHWKNWTLIQLWRVDIFRRAVPWSRLIVSGQTSGLNLNLSIRERLSSALAHGLWIWGGVSLIWPALWTAFAVTAAAYVLINARFFGLLWRKGGPALLLGGGLLQLCYHLYASATFACVVVVDWIELAAISLAPRWIKRRHDHLRRPAPARIEREDRV